MTRSLGTVQRLDLQIDGTGDEHYPRLRILIDGADLLAEDDELQGFPLEQMLGPQSPLLPVPGGRRVGVYLCGCGIAGCDVSAPWIEQQGEQIVWRDFRNYVGVFDGPTLDDDPQGGQLRRPEVFRFDVGEYLAEVERACAVDDWRTPQRQTIDAVNAALDTVADVLAGQGVRVHGLGRSHTDDSYTLWASLTHTHQPQGYRVRPPDDDPTAQAEWILHYLRSTPVVSFDPVLHRPHSDDTID